MQCQAIQNVDRQRQLSIIRRTAIQEALADAANHGHQGLACSMPTRAYSERGRDMILVKVKAIGSEQVASEREKLFCEGENDAKITVVGLVQPLQATVKEIAVRVDMGEDGALVGADVHCHCCLGVVVVEVGAENVFPQVLQPHCLGHLLLQPLSLLQISTLHAIGREDLVEAVAHGSQYLSMSLYMQKN